MLISKVENHQQHWRPSWFQSYLLFSMPNIQVFAVFLIIILKIFVGHICTLNKHTKKQNSTFLVICVPTFSSQQLTHSHSHENDVERAFIPLHVAHSNHTLLRSDSGFSSATSSYTFSYKLHVNSALHEGKEKNSIDSPRSKMAIMMGAHKTILLRTIDCVKVTWALTLRNS